ncbi:PE family protein [Mycobacterium sp. Marseille-P9652]|uniref:PE family protein n=1 Tax=Mycobacterium sp. Marseille-P9652 TaxID=2654950 RepID=UPI0012E988AA|nr:PE family protein [Mycobacterium sp. Marseille-P9652]
MSAVIATPELMEAAAANVASIGSTVNAAHMMAAAPTVSLLPAAADEVSAGIAHLFSGYAQDYQALAGKAAAFQDQFVQHLTAAAGAYVSAEAANIASLVKPSTAIAAPVAAAATAAQNVLNDLIAPAVTNIQGIMQGIVATVAIPIIISGFIAWLFADFFLIALGQILTNMIASIPFSGLVTSALIDAMTPLFTPFFTTFPILGQLVQSTYNTIFFPLLALQDFSSHIKW